MGSLCRPFYSTIASSQRLQGILNTFQTASYFRFVRNEAWKLIAASETSDEIVAANNPSSSADIKIQPSASRKEARELLNSPSVLWRISHLFARGKDDRTILSNINLAGVDLSLVKLQDANLKGAHFENAILAGANLAGANLAYNHFENADLIRANLQGANLEKADFRNASLTDANLTNACLNRADLRICVACI